MQDYFSSTAELDRGILDVDFAVQMLIQYARLLGGNVFNHNPNLWGLHLFLSITLQYIHTEATLTPNFVSVMNALGMTSIFLAIER